MKEIKKYENDEKNSVAAEAQLSVAPALRFEMRHSSPSGAQLNAFSSPLTQLPREIILDIFRKFRPFSSFFKVIALFRLLNREWNQWIERMPWKIWRNAIIASPPSSEERCVWSLFENYYLGETEQRIGESELQSPTPSQSFLKLHQAYRTYQRASAHYQQCLGRYYPNTLEKIITQRQELTLLSSFSESGNKNACLLSHILAKTLDNPPQQLVALADKNTLFNDFSRAICIALGVGELEEVRKFWPARQDLLSVAQKINLMNAGIVVVARDGHLSCLKYLFETEPQVIFTPPEQSLELQKASRYWKMTQAIDTLGKALIKALKYRKKECSTYLWEWMCTHKLLPNVIAARRILKAGVTTNNPSFIEDFLKILNGELRLPPPVLEEIYQIARNYNYLACMHLLAPYRSLLHRTGFSSCRLA